MIDGVLGASPEKASQGEAQGGSIPAQAGSDLNLGQPLDGASEAQGPSSVQGSAPPEAPPESSISIPQNLGKPPISVDEMPDKESLPEDVSPSRKIPESAAKSTPQPPENPPTSLDPVVEESLPIKNSTAVPPSQITQPADVPSSSLNLMPPPDLQEIPSSADTPIPSNLLIDPKGAEAISPSEPVPYDPPPSIPLLLPESQAPIKSDLFPMSGGGRDAGAGNQASILSLFGARLGLPGGYLGLRLGGALVTPLGKRFTRLGTYGLLVEVRQGSWAGLRFAYDVVPDFRSDVVTQTGASLLETVVSWRKLHIGWALAYNTRLFFDMFHVSPSVGIYGVSAAAPLTTDLDGVPEQRAFSVDRVVNFGLELDAEKIIFGDSLLRLWISRFSTFGAATALTKSTVKDARMTRAGVDLFVKGPKVSRKLHLSYMGFMSVDSMEIVTRDPDLLDPMVVVQMPFLGFGASLAW